MKKKLLWLVFILIIIAVVFSILGNNETTIEDFKPLEINLGDEFTFIKYDKKMYVLNYILEDVNGDEKKEMIIAIGEKENLENNLANNVDLVIYESVEKTFLNLKLKKFNGELPTLKCNDLTGDGIKDIVISATDENDNNIIRVVANEDGEFREIFKAKDNKGIIFTGNFIDGFKAYLKCIKYNKEVNVDLSDRKENYITNGFFDESGRLLKSDCRIKTSYFSSVDFVKLDGYFGLQTVQRIIGFDDDDLLDEITVIWKYEDGKWSVKEAKGNLVGNLLY